MILTRRFFCTNLFSYIFDEKQILFNYEFRIKKPFFEQ